MRFSCLVITQSGIREILT